MRNLWAALLAIPAVAACGISESTEQAEAQAILFHQLLDAGRYDAIYDMTGQEFREDTTEQEFIRLLEVIHDKLGTVESSERTSWDVSYVNGMTRVDLIYATDFVGGDGTEIFVFKMEDEEALLLGYKSTPMR